MSEAKDQDSEGLDSSRCSAAESKSFDLMAASVRVFAESMLEVHFGSRCPEYCFGCVICERYRMLDKLTESPY